jgi:hypothetical protein
MTTRARAICNACEHISVVFVRHTAETEGAACEHCIAAGLDAIAEHNDLSDDQLAAIDLAAALDEFGRGTPIVLRLSAEVRALRIRLAGVTAERDVITDERNAAAALASMRYSAATWHAAAARAEQLCADCTHARADVLTAGPPTGDGAVCVRCLTRILFRTPVDTSQ